MESCLLVTKSEKDVNQGYHDRIKKLGSELHGTKQDQRGPIESELNEYGHKGRVLAPVIGRYGGSSSDLSPILDLVARELARKHTAFYNIGFSEPPPEGGLDLVTNRRGAI